LTTKLESVFRIYSKHVKKKLSAHSMLVILTVNITLILYIWTIESKIAETNTKYNYAMLLHYITIKPNC